MLSRVIVEAGHTMKTGSKKIFISITFAAVLALLVLAPTAQALSFNTSDSSLSYLIVSATPDVSKPGDSALGTVSVTVTGKLSGASNQSDTFHIKLYVDTTSQPAKTVAEGDLVLPADATEGTAHFSVAIPSDAINNTYLHMDLIDSVKSYSKISLALIQNPTYSEIQSTIQTQRTNILDLQSNVQTLESNNNTTTLVMYIAIFVAVVFIVTTVYILSLTLRVKKSKKENLSEAV
jgi:hypothetical protein